MKILVTIISWLGIIWRKLKGFNEQYVFPAIDLLEVIRTAVKSDAVEWLVELTSFDWDDKLRNKLIEKLSKTILYLEISSDCLAGSKTPTEVIDCLIKHLKTQSPHVRDAIIQKIASTMVRQSMANGKIKQFEADLAVQMAYSYAKEKNISRKIEQVKNA